MSPVVPKSPPTNTTTRPDQTFSSGGGSDAGAIELDRNFKIALATLRIAGADDIALDQDQAGSSRPPKITGPRPVSWLKFVVNGHEGWPRTGLPKGLFTATASAALDEYAEVER